MSNHVNLTLHVPEETIPNVFAAALTPHPGSGFPNPITDYFATTQGLIQKIISTNYKNDSEVLGLLVLGVVSSAEFYFRAILSEITNLCPLAAEHVEGINIPTGSFSFYQGSGFAPSISAFEHESLADSKKIAAEIKRFVGFACADNASVKKALDDFELLCELRHCFIHSRGFAGLKAMRAVGGPRRLHKVLITQAQALELIKVAHNAVRAVNRYLADELLNRWIDRDVLVGSWNDDKALFKRFFKTFSVAGEDAYEGVPSKTYAKVRPIVLRRQQAIAAKVRPAGHPI